ncbi:uncharacterized protein GVI51_A04235 [Nakaseomyces glabratus]|uniref:COX assembly mitochondrial protein n=2 Tax=Candida glabrata TaxID=5478 RepID=Q6FXT1_CANGA|nr:uncharacterized protein CAGL0A04389g [Nakaseomyces glabratus]KAH7591486.1 Cytochrome c oxidase biogenesis protein Cmc1 like [Nakaseomyces glabratus]KAH7591935.1 Cytochrome c oxidase biogenesis protein Cmc1 like [Nakaseomyces glabratus]KAH7598966.1 Cytochrome c oxidase biogenesis protein Cmc1 like [Nakaseomyces glabratus]KAH7609413.1 Cytochrome c oxidase biogenesis protein Cmc1 like [Nakaseomyces glabratus]KAH7609822.1 Cytochrome c oxidase biogenesis protein Cmc1 like [Nakaseomyces glabratus|eukprot:XP_444958.2 uncharacterized protein CAGL0A04389g [[Candida] glabrata]
MHPQLEAQRFHSCLDYIEALDKCHQKEYYKRMLGLCNNEKDALTQCLKQASAETKKKAIQENKLKRDKLESKWRKIEEEEYGEDAILKMILDRELKKREGK